ncbi:SDR family mycofactocin-dependent oxidoreductase [Pseudonocardia ammonioxydans]|uniref:SDR family mycofactocin-dependent oxidoreductase n=1 Tax=Pseudonocardia ammonioxydans TaxID=260086 RepID=A0A1I4YFD7_PSUAM|nr:mycofactocin-coupled SDR family oxidoreductase [Pseudonocardia ammonioxydans]SFN36702.1 SDR family mycofactocin-dependent oxidoreductase [Pseudonocardia ammonioxydans]
MGRFDGKVALVTGAARGQGRNHALGLAREGADVIVVDLCDDIRSVPYALGTEADLAETVKLVETEDRRAVQAVVDVRDADAMAGAVDAAVAELGRLDIVVANAGVCSYGGIRDLTTAQWDDMIGTNLTGVFNTARTTIEHVIAAGGGAYVLTSSVYGLKGNGGVAHYTAAKHGVTGLMKAMTHEFAPHGIRVNSVHPTTVDTDMIQHDAQYKLFRPDLEAPTAEDAKAGFASLNIMPIPWVETSDITTAVLFLASDDARYITGVALPVDAGSMQI